MSSEALTISVSTLLYLWIGIGILIRLVETTKPKSEKLFDICVISPLYGILIVLLWPGAMLIKGIVAVLCGE